MDQLDLGIMLIEIDRRQAELTESYDRITREYVEITNQHNRRYAELQNIKHTILEKRRKDEEYMSKHHFDGYSNIRICDLENLTHEQLKYVAFKKFGKLCFVDNSLKSRLNYIRLSVSQDDIPGNEQGREVMINMLKEGRNSDGF